MLAEVTAFRLMVEFKAIELGDIEETNDIEYTENNNPATVRILRLKKDFEWFLSAEFKWLRDGFNPTDNRKYILEPDPEEEAAKAAQLRKPQKQRRRTMRLKRRTVGEIDRAQNNNKEVEMKNNTGEK